MEEWKSAYLPSWLYFDLTEWVEEEDMTDFEKEENPTYKTTGGYLRVYDYKEAFQKSYNSATREEQLKIKELPNFDAEKFYQISGIRIDDEPKTETTKAESKNGIDPLDKLEELENRLEGLEKAMEEMNKTLNYSDGELSARISKLEERLGGDEPTKIVELTEEEIELIKHLVGEDMDNYVLFDNVTHPKEHSINVNLFNKLNGK
jgi:hypothetical protein